MLARLTQCAQSFVFVIDRWPVDFRATQLQEPVLYLSSPPLDQSGSIDARILRSRRVGLVLIMADGGIGRIDLTSRRWEIWIASPQLREAIEELGTELKALGRWRFLTPNLPLFLTSLPLIAFASVVLYLMITDPVYSALSGGRSPVYDAFLNRVVAILTVPTIICIAVAFAAATVRQLGGSLRSWPTLMSSQGIVATIYRIRFSPFSRETTKAILIAVLSSILTAVTLYFLLGTK
jgi:hypothetical protein